MILKQKGGAPMGGIFSASFAILSCAYSEYFFNSSIGNASRFIRACRYMDDLFGVVVASRSCPISFIFANFLIDHLKFRCYHPNLILEEEHIRQRRCRYLEATLDITDNSVIARHYVT